MEFLQIDEKQHLEHVKILHAEIIFNAIDSNRDFLRKWLPFVDMTQKVSDTRAFIESVINKPAGERDDVFCIWYKNEFAGLIGFKDTDRTNCKTELGYWIIENFQGKGIITKTVSKLSDYAFKKMNINRIQIKAAVGNTKSSAIPKRLNFKYEGIEREGEKHLNQYLNLEVYSFLKKEWLESKKIVPQQY